MTGIYRDLYNNTNLRSRGYRLDGGQRRRVSVNSTNHDTTGYGVGAGVIVPLLPEASGLPGAGPRGSRSRPLRGFATRLPDAAVEADGRLHAVGAASALGRSSSPT